MKILKTSATIEGDFTALVNCTMRCFAVRGESSGCCLFGTASMLEWLRNTSLHTTHRGAVWKDGSRTTLRVVTARVFYVLRGFLTSPFILNNSVETAAPFNVVSHPRCCEPRNSSLEKFRPLTLEPVTIGTKCRLLNR